MTAVVLTPKPKNNYFKRKAQTLAKNLADKSGEKMEGRLHRSWFIVQP